MKEQKHSPEPWGIDKNTYGDPLIVDANNIPIAKLALFEETQNTCPEQLKENALRIRAMASFCKTIPLSVLSSFKANDFIVSLRAIRSIYITNGLIGINDELDQIMLRIEEIFNSQCEK